MEIQYIAEIIREASKSTLSIIALIIISITLIAFYFFRDAPNKIKLYTFILLFVGLGLLTWSMVLVTKEINATNTYENVSSDKENNTDDLHIMEKHEQKYLYSVKIFVEDKDIRTVTINNISKRVIQGFVEFEKIYANLPSNEVSVKLKNGENEKTFITGNNSKLLIKFK